MKPPTASRRPVSLPAAGQARGRSEAARSRIAPRAFLESRDGDGLPAVTPGSGPAPSHCPRPIPGDPVGLPTASEQAANPDVVGLRVLLAEDDPMVARSTIAVLRRLGHSVTHALDGTSAWRHLKSHMDDFDVLLLDVVMPRMGGSDLAHRARTSGFTGPIILMSGLIMEIDADALALLGAQRFMTKPFLPADLDRAIRGE